MALTFMCIFFLLLFFYYLSFSVFLMIFMIDNKRILDVRNPIFLQHENGMWSELLEMEAQTTSTFLCVGWLRALLVTVFGVIYKQ